MSSPWGGGRRLIFALAGVIAITWVFFAGLHTTDATAVALTYLLLILVVATTSPLWVAIATTVAAALALDFFFFPPVGRFDIDDPHDWAAFITFVTVSVVASRLSASVRVREQEAISRRDDLGRLFEFSRDVLRDSAGADGIAALARSVATHFHFERVALIVPGPYGDEMHEAGSSGARHPHHTVDLRSGPLALGALTVVGPQVEPPTLKTLASVVAIAVERARLLEARRRDELSQQRADMKSALLASIAHDIRTPLTAIQLALRNLESPSLTGDQRSSQVAVAGAAADRLTRLFQSIFEMTRIDAGDIPLSLRWVHPGEIVDTARRQVEPALANRRIALTDLSHGQSVCVDVRLTSAALAHVLENAAHYSPDGSTITVVHEVTPEGLLLSVHDEGGGISPSDLPHLFERFYRGGQSSRHTSGAGMGLAIARGLLAAEGGRIWVDDRADRGARFFLLVPAEHRVVPGQD